MTWNELASLSVTVTKEEMKELVAKHPDCKGIHESVLKSFQVLDKVEEYLRAKVPHSVILEMLEHVR